MESFLRLQMKEPPPLPPPPADAESQRGGTVSRSLWSPPVAAEAASPTSMSMALSVGARASMLVRLLLRPCGTGKREISLPPRQGNREEGRPVSPKSVYSCNFGRAAKPRNLKFGTLYSIARRLFTCKFIY